MSPAPSTSAARPSDALCSPLTSDAPEPAATSPTTVKSGGYKVPRAVRQQQRMDKDMSEFGPMETTYLATRFEVDDSTEYRESLLAMEALVAASAHPNRQQIRQVLALCFFPLFFKPPSRVSAFAKSTSIKPVLPAFDQDPIQLSHKSIREQATKLLEDLISTNGTETVALAIRGYGMPKIADTSSAQPEDPFDAGEVSPPPPNKKLKRGPNLKQKGKARQRTNKHGSDSDEDLSLSDSDDVLATTAKRIGRTENLWDFLAGTVARKPRVWKREDPILQGGWEVLRILVEGWHVELERKRKDAFARDTPVEPLSLLRYFKPSATSAKARELSSKALDVAFWPFTEHARPKSTAETDDDLSDQETDDDDFLSEDDMLRNRPTKSTKVQPDEIEVKFEGGIEPNEQKEVGVKLLLLIGESAIDGHLDRAATLADIVQRLKALDASSFSTFVELLSLEAKTTSAFVYRLLVAYLETYSHPLTTGTILGLASLSFLSSPAFSSIEPSSVQISPRKRALAAQNSLASLQDSSGNPSPNHSQATAIEMSKTNSQVEAEFWDVPSLNSKDFLAVAASIPIEVTLPQDAATTATSARKPKMTSQSGGKLALARAERALDAHRLVKEVLIQLQLERGAEIGNLRGSLDQAAANARQVVEDVDQAVRGMVNQSTTSRPSAMTRLT